MVDNTTLNTGTGGDVIGSDDIAGIKFQRVKLIHGADGVNAGDVATGNPLPTVQTGALPAGTNNIGDVDVLTQPARSHTTDSIRIGDGTDLALVSAAGALVVDGSGVTQPVSGTVSANLNAGTNNIGDVDVLTLPALVAGTANIGDVDVLTLPGVAGDVAHDGVDSGNPVKTGGVARTTNPTAVADGDRVNRIHDDLGRQVVVLNHVRDLVTDNTITLSTTTETTLLAQVASTFLDLTLLVITNTSATAVRVDIRDTTTGTVRISVGIAANGGAVIPFAVPRPQATVNTNWTAQLSAAVTDVRVYAQAVKNI